MIKIEIDGKQVEVKPGSMIIEAADQLRIPVPRFCYHKKLSIAANCRMCLVDVEKAPKPLPACATPAADGMKIKTRSKEAIAAQKSVMEFLLINHPLDCPICDQGGECELQDVAMGYGKDVSRFNEGKRVVKDENLGSLISTDMTRCIHCTRCVRFGQEVAGVRELGATGRGEFTRIGTFIEQAVQSEVSGNVIDLCPVGALTSKPFRFTARAWELQAYPGLAQHDCLGTNLEVHVRSGKVMRVVPRENEAINEVWLADRDRFSYQGLYHEARLKHPQIKSDGKWVAATWDEALALVQDKLQTIQQTEGGEQLAGIASANATVESYYLLQKLLRNLGCSNLDHRLQQVNVSDQDQMPTYPNLGLSIAELEQQQGILLIGSWIHQEQPLLGIRIRKAALNGAKVCTLNPLDFRFNFETSGSMSTEGDNYVSALLKLISAACKKTGKKIPTECVTAMKSVKPTQAATDLIDQLMSVERRVLLLGALVESHPDYPAIKALANILGQITQAKVGLCSSGCNAAGAWLAGFVPHRVPGGGAAETSGKNAIELWQKPVKGYILLDVDPAEDCVAAATAIPALKSAFVIACSAYKTTALQEVADVLIPITTFTEDEGSFVNVAGTWQTQQAISKAAGEARPAWKIFRQLGFQMQQPGFDYQTLSEVTAAIQAEITQPPSQAWESTTLKLESKPKNNSICGVLPKALYRSDLLVRHADALQKMHQLANHDNIYLNRKTAKQAGVAQGDTAIIKCSDRQSQDSLRLAVVIDENMPNQVACLNVAYPPLDFRGVYHDIQIEKA